MTTHRRLLLFGTLAMAGALAIGVWLLWPRAAITRENAAKIQVGMTLAEVETILGGPARNESTGQMYRHELPRGLLRREVWVSNEICFEVCLDPENRVADFLDVPVARIQERHLDKLRRWLGL